MRGIAKLQSEKPGKELHRKHYQVDPPLNGYRNVLVTRVNREVVITWGYDDLNRKYPLKTLNLKHTLIQAATSEGESISKVLRKFEYGITAADALNRAQYTVTT